MFTVTENGYDGYDEEYTTAFVGEALDSAASFRRAVVSHSDWTGYIIQWEDGGTDCKFFEGHDGYGFGGNIPDSARDFAKQLEARR